MTDDVTPEGDEDSPAAKRRFGLIVIAFGVLEIVAVVSLSLTFEKPLLLLAVLIGLGSFYTGFTSLREAKAAESAE